jgi:hypothetical protein
LGLELTDKVEHAPRMGGVNSDAFEHLGQQQISRLLVSVLENQRGHEIDKEAGNSVGVTDEIQHELYQLLLQLAFQKYHDILSQ